MNTRASHGRQQPINHLYPTPTGQLKARSLKVTTFLCLVVALNCARPDATAQPPPGGVVTNCTEAALRAAMAGGGTVTFTCDGTIFLANTITNTTNIVLDAAWHHVTISGSNSVRVFYVNTSVTLTLMNLTVANGYSLNGGGIFNNGGTVNAINCTFSGNNFASTGNTNAPAGGAIYNQSGTVALYGCTVANNDIQGDSGPYASGSPGYDAKGGAIYNAGSLLATCCDFAANSAIGGNGGSGPGAVSPFMPFRGYPGGNAGTGCGGAICNAGGMLIDCCLFNGNTATGGNGGNGGNTVNERTSYPGGSGGSGENGAGAAIFNSGTTAMVNSTIVSNVGTGGVGGYGGYADEEVPSSLNGQGGNGGQGGSGFAGICDTGDLSMTNCTIALNNASAGTGGQAGSGTPNGTPGVSGTASSLSTLGGTTLINTLVANGVTGSNCYGNVIDGGYNLSSDSSCAFTNIGSLNNIAPLLGPLTNNGGPTPTLALLPGSPAIDAGNSSAAPLTDQRGFPRPAGLAADIGAFEFNSVLPAIAISPAGGTGLTLLGSGNAGGGCRLLTSTDLINWTPIATNQIGTNGTIQFHEDRPPGDPRRFYCLVMP